MQIQEFFLDFVRVQDFSVDLSSVDMDNFMPMIIFILCSLHNSINRVTHKVNF